MKVLLLAILFSITSYAQVQVKLNVTTVPENLQKQVEEHIKKEFNSYRGVEVPGKLAFWAGSTPLFELSGEEPPLEYDYEFRELHILVIPIIDDKRDTNLGFTIAVTETRPAECLTYKKEEPKRSCSEFIKEKIYTGPDWKKLSKKLVADFNDQTIIIYRKLREAEKKVQRQTKNNLDC